MSENHGWMPYLLNLLLRLVLFAAGLVFAAVLAGFFALVLLLWLLGAAWSLLTGRGVASFEMRMGPRQGFREVMRRARWQTQPRPASRTPRSDTAGGARARLADVSDVEPK